MNAVKKAAFAATALVITLVGAAFATAPIAFARPEPMVAQQACSMPSLRLNLAAHVECQSASPGAGLVAFNRR
jgi:hypothetical protein